MIPQKLEQLIEPALADLGFECVRIRYMGGAGKSARGQLQIMAEPVDLREMTVEDCANISRHLSAVLDVEDPISDAYQLEISSPGMDRPLTRQKDFSRFAGELVKITLKQMLEGQKRYRGRLVGIDDDGVIHIETATGRVSASLDQIDTAKIDPTEFFSTQKQPAKTIKQARKNKEEA
ncbi:MAG: ribosome maturation factor RimP [Alphaproteobacteria bacterium]|jgi:ribosome maturation factor RimP|nr:ribosome maturation factor RimP [Alphaproteobacteria bacterium]MBL6776352.1 ribosome maturation factor RimP [Alphaproteobacteria bacterium]MDC1135127.1 ribosome maturation factor RimP [Alphaproteobacteria bacterium]